MQSTRGAVRLALTAVVLGACGAEPVGTAGDAGVEVDARVGGWVCWPEVETTLRGTVVLGTGQSEFAEMPAELPLVYGVQGGFHVEAHARMEGLFPGDPRNSLAVGNPRTRFSASFVATGEPLTPPPSCATSIGYGETDAAGMFELATGNAIIFDTALQGAELFGQELDVFVEVIDRDGGYARDERRIVALPPVGWPEADAGPM